MKVIGMRTKDIIKSIILACLVLSSIILTVMIWNFSPDLTDADNTQQSRSTTTIGTQNNHPIDETITPLQLVHISGSDVEGSPATDQVQQLLELLRDGRIQKVEDIQNEEAVLLQDISDDIVVLDYPTDIPLSVYLSDAFDLSAKVPEQFQFDRLVLDLHDGKNIKVYALQHDRQRAIKLTTSLTADKVQSSLKQMDNQMEAYSNISTDRTTINKATFMYVQKEPKEMRSYRTIFNQINVEDLNAILFDNTPIVRTGNRGNMTYNNNTGVVNYDSEKQTYAYTNLSEDDMRTRDMTVSIPRTIDYINKHGGFTDDFRLFDVNDQNGEITYQMFQDGRPIFYPNQLNQIRMIWGERGIFEYSRGLLKTNVSVDNGEKPKDMEDADTVRTKLASNSAIDFSSVEQMIVGYHMDTESSPESAEDVQNSSQFIPTWFIKYDGNWYEYDDGELNET